MTDFAHTHHHVQFYETEHFLCEAVARFFFEPLLAGKPALLIATDRHRAAFGARLKAAGYDFEQGCKDGQVLCLDAEAALATFMIGARPDEQLFRAQIGGLLDQVCGQPAGDGLHAYGEMVDVLWRAGNRDAALQVERFWNQLALGRSFKLLCGYSLDGFTDAADAEQLRQVCGQHGLVRPAESFTPQASLQTRAIEMVVLQQRMRALEHEIATARERENALIELLIQARASGAPIPAALPVAQAQAKL